MTITLTAHGDLSLAEYRRVAFGGETVRLAGLSTDAREEAALEPTRSSRYQTGGLSSVPRGLTHAFVDERVVRGIAVTCLARMMKAAAEPVQLLGAQIASLLDSGPLPEMRMAELLVGADGETLERALRQRDDGLGESEREMLRSSASVSAALVADATLQACSRLALAEAIFALSIEAFDAPLDAYNPTLADLWGADPHDRAALQALDANLAGVAPRARRPYQAPVSYRILPRVLGQAHRAVSAVQGVADFSLAALAPIGLPEGRDRRDAPSGAYDAVGYPALDAVCATWADLSTLADRHVAKLMDSSVSLLPDLIPTSQDSGAETNPWGRVTAALGEQARQSARRTFLPSSENAPSARDDLAAPTAQAFAKEQEAGGCLEASLAVLAAVASQALFVTGRDAPPALANLLDEVRFCCPPLVTGAPAADTSGLWRLADVFGRLVVLDPNPLVAVTQAGHRTGENP